MSTIFISYRRDDSAAACGRIYERLAAHFGRDTVFKDVDDLPYGVRFPDYLSEQLRGCRVELVMIGRYWLTLTTPDGIRRLDMTGDFVRTEIETGLRGGLIVVPVLVDNAGMPHPEELPESIRELVEYNGAQVRNDPDFNADMQRLIRQLERWLGITSLAGTPPTPSPTTAIGAQAAAPADPQAAFVAQLLPGIRAAAASRDWHLVLDKADYLTGAVPTASVPAEVWRLVGEACYGVGDFARAGTALKSALALVDAHTERLALLRDYAAALIELKQWDELLRRAEEGSRLAPDDPFWLRTRLRALAELHRDEEVLVVLRMLTARSDATIGEWLARSRLARTVANDDSEVRSALDAAAHLAGSNGADDSAIAAASRELFPPSPPIPPDQFPNRLASLGFTARKAGDPQTGKDVSCIVPPIVSVPAGSFQMGKVNPRDQDAQYDGPPRTLELPAFAIARYPISVAEYACFVRAGQEEPQRGTYGVDWRTQLTRLDHPVTCVSWHDATAYAAWLALLTGQLWRLPAEEEWEKAARWDSRSGKSFVYPWGDTFDAARCNTSESNIHTTTLVGKYGAAGASPCGAEDMAGNVWEWTNSVGDSSTGNRVLRGGSWYGSGRYARAAYRPHDRPDYFSGSLGFRLVLPAAPGS